MSTPTSEYSRVELSQSTMDMAVVRAAAEAAASASLLHMTDSTVRHVKPYYHDDLLDDIVHTSGDDDGKDGEVDVASVLKRALSDRFNTIVEPKKKKSTPVSCGSSRKAPSTRRRLRHAISAGTSRNCDLASENHDALLSAAAAATDTSVQGNEQLTAVLHRALDICEDSSLEGSESTTPEFAAADRSAGARLDLKGAIGSLTKLEMERIDEVRKLYEVARIRTSLVTSSPSPSEYTESPVEKQEKEEESCPFLMQCAEEGISAKEAKDARDDSLRLLEDYWNRGHEKDAEAAAEAAGAKRDPNYHNNIGNHNNNRGGGKKDDSGDKKGPARITLPPSMADKAQVLQDKLKADTVQLLCKAGGDSTNPRFVSAFKVLSSIYKGRGYDARSRAGTGVEGNTNNKASTFEGEWNLLSKPMYPDCLGRNDDGHFMYTLAQMSFSMLQPGDAVCSIQRITHSISIVGDDDSCRPEAVPRKLREAVSEGPYRNGLRKYDIAVYITIEPKIQQQQSPEGELPPSPVSAVMSNSGYMLPDEDVENRFSVWFTGGSLRPAQSTSLTEFRYALGYDEDGSAIASNKTLGDRARILAAKLLLGAEVSSKMGADGLMGYKFNRPIPGHIDVVYTDNTLQILKGNRGSVMVQSRKGKGLTKLGASSPPKEERRKAPALSSEGQARIA